MSLLEKRGIKDSGFSSLAKQRQKKISNGPLLLSTDAYGYTQQELFRLQNSDDKNQGYKLVTNRTPNH